MASATKIRIWGRRDSVNVQKVLWCLAELAVPYERIDAGLQHGKNTEPWYLALNPNGRVPLLRDGDFTLWEAVPMRRDGNRWVVDLEVEAGTHHYGYLVDGEWYMPEDQESVVPDEWGRMSAILVIEGEE